MAALTRILIPAYTAARHVTNALRATSERLSGAMSPDALAVFWMPPFFESRGCLLTPTPGGTPLFGALARGT